MSPRVTAAFERTFVSLRSSRNFRLYLLGQFVSAVGTWMNFTASSWLVLQLTGSGTALGINGALHFGPVLLLGPFGGVLADRFDKRKILAATQAAYAGVALTLAALVAFDAATLGLVYALALVAGIVTAIDNPARQSFYVEMVGEEVLTNAVSLNSAAFTGSRIIGPAIAGILIGTVGMAACFLIDGLSYLAVLGALLAMRTDELHEQRRSTRERGHLLAGFRYVWRTDELRRPLIILAIVFTFAFQWAVLVPLLAERVFDSGAREFGFLSAAAGIGSFAAALTFAHRGGTPTMRVLGLSALGTGAASLLIAVAPTLEIAALAMIPIGYASMAFMITGNTMLQLTAKPEARGRVMALYGVVFLGSIPLGAPIVGALGEFLGVQLAFAICALVPLAVGGSILWRRRLAVAAAEVGTAG
ncbi:MAG TPA: MFS transporter [Actinomycetota bacterium]